MELEDLARSLNVTQNIRFLGASDKIFSLLKMCDVFCLLSRSEGFSNALLEAMACGLPCVVTDVGGNREAVVDARSGFLVPNEDVGAAARRVLALLENPASAKQMGQFGRRIVQDKFTTEVMISHLATLYDGLLHRAR
jgi:glycosyltransferase involved in cell wall biosynthesis